MSSSLSDGVVVVMGDPRDTTRDYQHHLEHLARTGDTDVWKVPMGAQVGDMALVYLIRPVSAIVAFATVLSDPVEANGAPNRAWGDGWYAELGGFGLFDEPITRDELLAEVPAWRWPVQPHTATLPRGEAAEQLMDHLAPKSLELRLLESVGSTVLVENDSVYSVVQLGTEFLVTAVTTEEFATGVPARVVGRSDELDDALDMMGDEVRKDAVALTRG